MTATNSASAVGDSHFTFRASRITCRAAGFTQSLFAPVDIASLAAFRFLFGVIMAGAMIRFMAKGWVRELYLAPAFHFPYPGFEWVRPLPDALMYAHFILLA